MNKLILAAAVLLALLSGPSGTDAFEAPSDERLSELLVEFEGYAVRAMKDWEIPGMAISIVRGDRVLLAKGFGVRKLGSTQPTDEHTLFQIGSVSKSFTATLVAMLADRKKIAWTDPVTEHLPDFSMFDPWVTREFRVFDLMAQRSGMSPYAADFLSLLGFERAHILRSLRFIRPVSSFRSEFAYVNNLFVVAGLLVEKYSDRSWEDTLQARILDPLGMKESSAAQKAFTGASNVAWLHRRENAGIRALPMDWPFMRWVYSYGPAGGIASTASDMTKWMRFQLAGGIFEGKRLVSEKNLDYTHAPRTPIAASGSRSGASDYCMGWVRSEYRPYSLLWHNGATSGISSVVVLAPEIGLGITVLTNLADTSAPEAIAKRFVDLYCGTTPLRDWNREALDEARRARSTAGDILPDSPVPPMPLDVYEGTYDNPVFGSITLLASGDVLTGTMGPDRVRFIFRHRDRDEFVMSVPDFDPDAGRVRFTLRNGAADSLVIDDLQKDGIGAFFRKTP